MRTYEFNKGTLAILPNGKESSLIYEDRSRYIVEDNPMTIMEESCKYFGSTYEGRRVSARELLGAEYKIPIIVEDSDGLVAFPTASPGSNECAWLSLSRIDNIYEVDHSNTKVVFDNGREIIIPCSFRSLESQISRAARLRFILTKRKEKHLKSENSF